MKIKENSGRIKRYVIEVKPYKQTIPPTKTKNKKSQTYISEVKTYAVNDANGKMRESFVKIGCWNSKLSQKRTILMPQTNKVNYNTSRTNRIEEVYTDIVNAQGADDKMEIIIETLSETVIIPDIGRGILHLHIQCKNSRNYL